MPSLGKIIFEPFDLALRLNTDEFGVTWWVTRSYFGDPISRAKMAFCACSLFSA